MEFVPVLVEGITDRSFLEYLPGLKRDRLDFGRAEPRGQDKAKADFASQIRAGVRAILCLDIDDKSPKAKFAEVKNHLDDQDIPIVDSDVARGSLVIEWGEVLFVPLGLWGDEDLQKLKVTRHSFEDYLIRTALDDQELKHPAIVNPIRECLEQVVSEYAQKGCSSFSSAQVYQFLKPFLGLPKHETSAISQLLRRANRDVVSATTSLLVETVNSFLARVG